MAKTKIKEKFFYKWLRTHNKGKTFSGPFTYSPIAIGKWLTIEGEGPLVYCSRGFHFVKWEDRKMWRRDDCYLFKVEVGAERYYDVYSKKGLARRIKILYRVSPVTKRKV